MGLLIKFFKVILQFCLLYIYLVSNFGFNFLQLNNQGDRGGSVFTFPSWIQLDITDNSISLRSPQNQVISLTAKELMKQSQRQQMQFTQLLSDLSIGAQPINTPQVELTLPKGTHQFIRGMSTSYTWLFHLQFHQSVMHHANYFQYSHENIEVINALCPLQRSPHLHTVVDSITNWLRSRALLKFDCKHGPLADRTSIESSAQCSCLSIICRGHIFSVSSLHCWEIFIPGLHPHCRR